MIKQYLIGYHADVLLTIEVDHSIFTEEVMTDINNQWDGSRYRIGECDGLLNAVLMMLAKTIITIEMDTGRCGIVSEMIMEFDPDQGFGQKGWPKLDGSAGLTLKNVSQFEIDVFEIEVEEAEPEAYYP